MSTSSIFKYANDISINRSSSSARSVSTGGYARTHRLGPSIISLDVDLPILSEEQYLEVENELFSIDDGIKFLTANISSNNGNNIMSGVATPLATGSTSIQFLTTDYSSLRTIVLCNLASNVEKIFKVGDFIQFANHAKVYQISKPINESGAYFRSSSNGTCKVRLSTPLLSAIGYSNNASTGYTNSFYIVNGKGDNQEMVEYDFDDGSFSNPIPPSVFPTGIFTFVNVGTNTPYQYLDGTQAIVHIAPGLFTSTDISSYLDNCANGTGGTSGPYATISQSRADQNNKLGQVVSGVSSTGVGPPNDQLLFVFKLPNVRVQLTAVSYAGAALTNETVLQTITTPYRNGLITFKNSDNTTLKDRNGNDATIILPSYLQNALQIYDYINNTILATDSTHVLKTHNIVIGTTSPGPNFPELFGESDLDHVGYFSLQFGPEYGDIRMELTTSTGPVAVNYNPITKLSDVVQAVSPSLNQIEIDNPTETYNVGDYLQPTSSLISISDIQRVSSVFIDPILNIAFIDFDTSFNPTIGAAWSHTVNNNTIQRHLNTATTTTTTGLVQLLNTDTTGSLSIATFTTVKTGPDVNLKLMLTKKPAVTIIPKDETKNLYKYDKFEFQEVL